MLEKLTGNTKIIEKALDASWIRNDAISQNIANVDTPGYKRKTVAFEEYLCQALERSNQSIPIGRTSAEKVNVGDIEIKIIEDNKSLSTRLDGNNVDIDSEMASMAKNTIKYNTLVQSLNAEFRRIKSAISEGR